MAPELLRVPVAVLTGFLGSGKTTLLNRLLKHPELRDTAVIVNEFGAIGIDHLLVEHAGAEPILLENGCLCCTARGELAATLDSLRRRRARGEVPFSRVIVETTGLASPAPILDALVGDADVAHAFVLGGIVATVDALCGARTLDRYEEAREQAAIADRLVLTKTDLAESDAAATLAARLRALNPAAPIDRGADAAVGQELLFCGDPTASRFDAYDAAESHPHGRIQSFCLTRDRPIGWDALKLWLSVLAALCGERLLRVKGFVAVAQSPDRPFLVQGVQHVFDAPVQLRAWPDNDRRTRLVFITDGLSRDLVAGTLDIWDDFAAEA
jgi:G3E family GTPase